MSEYSFGLSGSRSTQECPIFPCALQLLGLECANILVLSRRAAPDVMLLRFCFLLIVTVSLSACASSETRSDVRLPIFQRRSTRRLQSSMLILNEVGWRTFREAFIVYAARSHQRLHRLHVSAVRAGVSNMSRMSSSGSFLPCSMAWATSSSRGVSFR